MTRSRGMRLAITTSALAILFAVDVQQAFAQPQTLMDFFRERRMQREARPPAQQQAVPPAQAPVQRAAPVAQAPRQDPPRISGPSYNSYRTDALVKVDFSAIEPHRENVIAVPAAAALDHKPVGSTEAADEAVAEQARVFVELNAGQRASDALPEAEAAEAVKPQQEDTAAAEGEGAVEAASSQEAQEPVAARAEDSAAAPVSIAAEPERLTDAQIAALQSFDLTAEKEIAEAIVAHYSAQPALMWVSEGKPNDRASQAMATLGDAASHGLDPRDYSVPLPASGDADALARFEMELSARLLRYVRDARSGRIDPNRISAYYDFAPKPLDHVASLAQARTVGDVPSFLEAQHPQSEQYRALRVELEMLRASPENDIVIAPGTLVRPGETNAEFPKILSLILRQADEAFRGEHGDVLTRNLGGETYAQELVPVIKAAQRAAGVGDDGVIGPRTVQAIAGDSRASRIRKVEVALEQIRWLAADFGDRYVHLNTPAFEAVYVEDGKPKLTMRTVVGSNATQTYFFQDEIQYVEFNPFWGVPRSILVNKYMPKLYRDPSYLDRNGFEVVNSRGQVVPSSSVNWGAYGTNVPFNVRQRPGSGNALGELKIMFPNKHAIYMHDTPEKHLFGRENRALSNGCIRLEDPRGMAAAVLGWDRAQLDSRLASSANSRANLDVKVPVYVTYFTAWPDASGKVSYHNDVYGRDDRVAEAIAKVEALRSPGV